MSKYHKNPFKFGSVVDSPYFTNRKNELEKVKSILESNVHLIIMSPRRYGKTSLILKAVKEIERPFFNIDMQIITSEIDLAEQLLKKVYRLVPFEKVKRFLKGFRITPNISMNPLSEELTITFETMHKQKVILEDVLNLLNRISGKGKRLIAVFDEFQSIRRIGQETENMLRSIMQYHDNINYVFLGSQESLMHNIFVEKNSPFFNFGYLFTLSKIAADDFMEFLKDGFSSTARNTAKLAEEILNITKSHPYFTQQIAFEVWERIRRDHQTDKVVQEAYQDIIRSHDIDYERFWNTFNSLDMKVLTGLAFSNDPPTSEVFIRKFRTGSSSSTYSSLQRLVKNGYVVKADTGYVIDDPFFKGWIIERRQG